jgi:hypothetical protein
MGSWGTGIFQDDVACDVRDAYTEMVSLGFADEVISRELQAAHGRADGIDESTSWIALALCQHKVGRLTTATRERACAMIESGRAIAEWEELTEPGDPTIASRARALAKALATLRSAQPTRKSPRPSKELRERIDRSYVAFPWREDSLWAWRRTRGDFVVLAVSAVRDLTLARHYRTDGAGFAIVQVPVLREPCFLVLDYCNATPPTRAQLETITPLGASESSARYTEAAAAVDGIRAVWSDAASRTYEQFVDETRELLGHFSPDQLRRRYAETVEHAAGELMRYADRDHAIARQFYTRVVVDPREAVPVGRLVELDSAKHFDCEDMSSTADWARLSDQLDALRVSAA